MISGSDRHDRLVDKAESAPGVVSESEVRRIASNLGTGGRHSMDETIGTLADVAGEQPSTVAPVVPAVLSRVDLGDAEQVAATTGFLKTVGEAEPASVAGRLGAVVRAAAENDGYTIKYGSLERNLRALADASDSLRSEIVDAAVDVVESGSSDDATDAVELLGKVVDDQAAPDVIGTYLGHSDAEVRREAINGLESAVDLTDRQAASDLANRLGPRLDDDDASVRLEAARALRKIGGSDSRAVVDTAALDSLCALLTDGLDDTVDHPLEAETPRGAAADAVAGLWRDSGVREDDGDGQPPGCSHASAVLDPLSAALGSSVAGTVVRAADALGAVGAACPDAVSTDDVDRLCHVARSHEWANGPFRRGPARSAAKAVGTIGEVDRAVVEGPVDRVIDRLESRSSSTVDRVRAVRTLGEAGSKVPEVVVDAVDPLTDALADDSAALRETAAASIGRIARASDSLRSERFEDALSRLADRAGREPDDEAHEAVVAALGAVGQLDPSFESRAVDQLLSLVADGDGRADVPSASIRREAVDQLKAFAVGRPRVVTGLLDLLDSDASDPTQSDRDPVRQAASSALGSIADDSPALLADRRVVDVMRSEFEHNDGSFKNNAVRVLQGVAREEPGLLADFGPTLRNALHSNDWYRREDAAGIFEAVSEGDPTATVLTSSIDDLVEALGNPSEQTRATVARTVGNVAEVDVDAVASAVDPLCAILTGDMPTPRGPPQTRIPSWQTDAPAQSALALGRLLAGSPDRVDDARPALAAGLEHDRGAVRAATARAVGRVAEVDPDSVRSLGPTLSDLPDGDVQTRYHHGPPWGGDTDDPVDVSAAAEALATIEGRSGDTVVYDGSAGVIGETESNQPDTTTGANGDGEGDAGGNGGGRTDHDGPSYCPACGTDLGEYDAPNFCPACGEALPT